jgi:UDP-glucose 4-epimerase
VLHRRRRRANGLPPFSQGLRLSILVTGGAGFVATTLIARLLERGETVLAVDNMSRGSAANLGALQRNPRLKIVVADIADLPSFRAALRAHSRLGPITASWHLAANSDIPAGIANANVDLKDTFLTTFNTLQVMEEHGVREIFFASSSAIYGDLGDTVLTENVGPLFPISNYGAMKLASEALVTAAAEKFLARAILFRFPNVVGVPATHGVLLDFIRRLKADRRQLQVLGDGTQQKSYLHVSDLAHRRGHHRSPYCGGNHCPPRPSSDLEIRGRKQGLGRRCAALRLLDCACSISWLATQVKFAWSHTPLHS